MNYKELNKRVLTSIILLPALIISIFSKGYYFNILLVVVLVIATYEWYIINKKSYIYFILGFFVIFSSLISAHFLRGGDFESQFFFLWLISIAFFSDTGGYVFGKFFGGKKLTKISPNKTVSGMIGSFIFSIFPILIIHFSGQIELINLNLVTLSIKTFFLSLFFSFICQMGDILVSYFKRKNNIKDAGNILPGHGGLLDRIDGLIFLLLFSSILNFLKII